MNNKATLTKNTLPVAPTIIHTSGLELITKNGKKILDFSSQTLNLNLGQRHPVVLRALKDHLDSGPTFLSSRFLNPDVIKLANLLVHYAPKGLSMVNLKLTNGSDANESAFKRVRAYRKKPYIVSYRFSHLGETSETVSASGSLYDKRHIGGSGKFIFIDPQFLTCRHSEGVSCQRSCLQHIEKLFQQRNDIAAIILEPIMVHAGAYGFTSSYLRLLQSLCTAHRISLIFDEVQTAFGWTGHIYYCCKLGVTPDLLTLGKSLSAGYPLAAVLMKSEYDVLDFGVDEFTGGGHVLSTKTALSMLRYIKRNRLLSRVAVISKYFTKRLQEVQHLHPKTIVAIRTYGLITAIELSNNHVAKRIYQECLNKGLLLRACQDGLGDSLVLKPALIVSKKQIDTALSILSSVLRHHTR